MIRLSIPLKILRELVLKCIGVQTEKVFLGVGTSSGNAYTVVDVFECRNISSNPQSRFIADPLCVYRVLIYAESRKMDIVALIHSHPTEPIPSVEDLRGMKLWGIPWLIIDNVSGRYRAWILRDGEPEEVFVEEL